LTRFIFVGILGILSGMLLAPRKGSDLRNQMGSKFLPVLDKFFCALAMNLEPTKPRQPEPLADSKELEAGETLSRIKAALDGKSVNEKERLAS